MSNADLSFSAQTPILLNKKHHIDCHRCPSSHPTWGHAH